MERFLLALFCLLVATPTHAGDLPRAPVDGDYRPVRKDMVKLGRFLFYDPVLSGNKTVACASCHHPRFATSDGLSLGLGDGGIGLGPVRKLDLANMPEQRVPRNAQALFNLGAFEFTKLFYDGRIEVDPSRPVGMRTPLEDEMVVGFENVLSAQTMFPVLSPDEMAGHYQENDVSKAVRSGRLTGTGGAWDLIAKRVSAIPEYVELFESTMPEIAEGRAIAFTDISNAISEFVASEWRSDGSPFDTFLRHQRSLPTDAQKGMELFYGEKGCAPCHAGPFLTDQDFHVMADPQLGPGKAERFESHSRDVGRMRVTGRELDAFKFRTPSLRNVLHTGPWGHAGAFSDLRAYLKYHANPKAGFVAYVPQATLPDLPDIKSDWAIRNDPQESAALLAVAPEGPGLTDQEVEWILAFLKTLSDPVALAGRLGIPDHVPSGLPVDH